MLRLFHLLLSKIETEWPKAVFGSIFPISQFLWKILKDRSGETKKKVLRERITELARFHQATAAALDTPQTSLVTREAEKEYHEAIEELAKLSAPATKKPVRGWVLQTLLFILFLIVSVSAAFRVSYHYSYLLGVLILGEAWAACYVFGQTYRRKILWGSITGAPLALTSVLFVPQYWTPPSIFDLDTRIGIGIEDFLLAAVVGGISSVVSELCLKTRLAVIRKVSRKRHFAPFIVVVIVYVILQFWHPNMAPFNIAIAFFMGSVVTAVLRPELISIMLVRSLSFVILQIVWLMSLQNVYPDFTRKFFNIPNLLGVYVLGMPVERLLFAATSGLIWSVAYEYVQSYSLKLLSGGVSPSD